MLCSLTLVLVANAGNDAYPVTEYQWATAPTIDGKWTTPSEWTDGPIFTMSNNSFYEYKMDFTTFAIAWLVESHGDNTNDPGDLWQICLDPDNSGGGAPGSGDFKIEIQGHTTLKIYQGTGSGWSQLSGTSEILWANTMTTSPYNTAPHWVLEVEDPDKTTGTIITPQPPNGMGVFSYDASSGKLSAWPPGSSPNVPSGWGVISGFDQAGIPEGFSIGVVVLLSSVAVTAGFYYLRKRPRIANMSPTKL